MSISPQECVLLDTEHRSTFIFNVLGAPSDIQQDHQHGSRRSSRQDQSPPERGLHRSYNDT